MCNRLSARTKYWLAHPAWHCVTEFLIPHTDRCNSSKHFISSLVARVYRVCLVSACVCFDVIFALWVTCKIDIKDAQSTFLTVSATGVLAGSKHSKCASFRMLLQIDYFCTTPHTADPLTPCSRLQT